MILDRTTAKLVLRSPDASPETLAEIAQTYPDLRAQVAAHPNATPDLASAPPKRWPKRRRAAVLAGACIVAIALVVWFVALPQFANRGTLPTPDITAQPTWSDPIKLTPPASADMSDPQILDPQAGNIAVAYWNLGGATVLQGIDLATKAKLWQLQRDTGGNVFPTSGYIVFYAEDSTSNGRFEVIDARTGKTTATVALAPGETPAAIANGIVLIWGNGTFCARALANPTHCAWQSAAASGGIVPVFGGGTWAYISSGSPLAWKTGQPAPFGSDTTAGDSDPWVDYDGPDANHIARVTDATPGSGITTETVQPWDTVHDRGFFPAVLSDMLVVDQKASTLVTTQTSGTSTALAAYGWQTGAIRWQADVDWGFEPSQITSAFVCADSVLLRSVPYSGPGVAAMGSWIVVNTQSRQEAWSFDGAAYTYVGNGNRVVYMMSGSTLIAFDAASPTFTQLWTLDLPADAMPTIVAGHIIELAGSYLWVAE